MNINKYLKCGIVLGALVYSVGTSIPTQSTYADEINTETVVKEWKPEGKVIATGEDGVPWELYENGYLLFKPEPGKDTLSTQKDGMAYWKTQNIDREKIKAIGFTDKVYLPEDSSNLFSSSDKGETLLNKGVAFLETNKIDTSKVKNMSGMFGRTGFTKLDLNNWNTSNVEDMSHLFDDSGALTELKIDKWNTSKVKSMKSLFAGLFNLKELNIQNWDTSNVEDMFGMFSHMEDLLKLDLNKWDTSNVNNMASMFSRSNVSELNISNWNTSKVETMEDMFGDAQNLKKLELGKWDVSNVDNMANIFQGTSSLTYLDVSSWDTSRVADDYNPYMFYEAKALTHLKIGNKFTNSKRNENLFKLLNEHNYGDKYTEKWRKSDKTTPFYTIDEWDKEYKANPDKLAGMWVRENNLDYYTLTFETGTDESIEPLEVEIGKDFELPVPTKIKEGYHFAGWRKKQDGEVIKDKNNFGKKNETIILYAKWEKNPPVSSNTPNDENNNPILPPTVNELPEYTGPLSTNTPVDENGNLILPPVVDELPEFNGGVNSIEPPVEEKPEYKGPISTNTPVDDNGDLITPPTVEKPEYKEPVSTDTPVDNNGDSILSPTVEKAEYKDDLTKEPETSKEETKPVESKKEKELPNTNSTSILTTLVSSVIGTLGLGYKSKRRK